MKKTYYICLGILLSFLTFSCTDVVNIDVPNIPKKLVVDASIDWEKGTKGNVQMIKLSTTLPFFSKKDTKSYVDDALVKITNKNTGEVYPFTFIKNGMYENREFKPMFNHTFELEISYQNQKYTAEENFIEVPDIYDINQTKEGGFSSDDWKVKFYFKDTKGIRNYYLISHKLKGDIIPNYYTLSDDFVDGSEINFYADEGNKDDKLEIGDMVSLKLYSISERYFNYMSVLVKQVEEGAGGNPFSSPPVQLKGNIKNDTNPENYPLGYFRLTQVFSTSYTLK